MVVYDKYDILFQEIPDETSLAFTLKACQFNCIGCHSPHLRGVTGNELNVETISNLIVKYGDSITNILFLGEGSDINELIKLMAWASKFKKVSLYSGKDYIEHGYLPYLSYYKVGSYQESLGGLSSENTNQRLYKIECEDITHKFRK
jgi:anaerobic ribonucleoside-triphosphate reductase activating protein